MNKFSILREESSIDDFYETGPWTTGDRYLEANIQERLHREIIDIEDWLRPTEDEERLRMLTIKRFSDVIEAEFPGCYVIPQGSSATNTYLPTSDIDLIIMNLPEDSNPVLVIKMLAKVFQKAQMISNSLVLAHAKVPIAKLIERPFGFHIDLCASNINGSLNIPRVSKVLSTSPLMRPMLMFFKLFVWAFAIDDPAVGGFGSNFLLNFVHFGIQSRPDITNLGDMLIYLLEVIAVRLNHYAVGISTVNGGQLVPKGPLDLISKECPEAFVIEDPQFHGNWLGTRTHAISKFVAACSEALESIQEYNYTKISAISSFLPDTNQIHARRNEMERCADFWRGSADRFSRFVASVPTHVKFNDAGSSKKQKQVKRPKVPAIVMHQPMRRAGVRSVRFEADEWDDVLSKTKAKQLRKEQKKEKQKSVKIVAAAVKRQNSGGKKPAGKQGNFNDLWTELNAQARMRREDGHQQRKQNKRNQSPKRFSR